VYIFIVVGGVLECVKCVYLICCNVCLCECAVCVCVCGVCDSVCVVDSTCVCV